MRTRSCIVLGALAALLGCRGELTSPSGPAAAPSPDMAVTAAATDSVVLMIAGDMHANCLNKAKATAAIVKQYPEAMVIVMGDNAGQHGTSAEYKCYDQTWGEFKSRTYPAIGNHELNQDTAATAYYDYFNGVGVDSGRAGRRGYGYYSLVYGGWRIFVANSNYQHISAQGAWMTRELAASPKLCTMAVWHRPVFTSSARPPNVQLSNFLRPWWTALYNGRADLVLAGHVHSYERFNRLRPDGVVDTARGIREFVVGTGGTGALFDFLAVAKAGSQKRIKTWGVLKLTLWPTRYEWQFIDITGAVLDQGRDICGGDPTPSTITLTVAGEIRSDGKTYSRLQWQGALGDSVNVHRNGSFLRGTENDGLWTQGLLYKGPVTYTFRICERVGSLCSNDATVSYQ